MAKDNKKSDVPKNPRVDLYSIAVYYIFQECFIKARIIADNEFEERRWAGRLVKEINASPEHVQISESESYKQYLIDRFRLASNDINANKPYAIKGYSKDNLKPLFSYIGISEYDEFNGAFRMPQSKYIIHDVKNSKLSPDAIIKFLTVMPEQLSKAVLNVKPAVDEPPIKNECIIGIEKEPVKVLAVYASKPYSRFDIFGRIAEDEGQLWFYDNGDGEWRGDKTFMIEQPFLNPPEEFRMPNDSENLWVKLHFLKNQEPCYAYFGEQANAETPLRLLPPKKILDYFLAGH